MAKHVGSSLLYLNFNVPHQFVASVTTNGSLSVDLLSLLYIVTSLFMLETKEAK